MSLEWPREILLLLTGARRPCRVPRRSSRFRHPHLPHFSKKYFELQVTPLDRARYVDSNAHIVFLNRRVSGCVTSVSSSLRARRSYRVPRRSSRFRHPRAPHFGFSQNSSMAFDSVDLWWWENIMATPERKWGNRRWHHCYCQARHSRCCRRINVDDVSCHRQASSREMEDEKGTKSPNFESGNSWLCHKFPIHRRRCRQVERIRNFANLEVVRRI